MNTVAYVNAVSVEERDGERCVPHVYPLAELSRDIGHCYDRFEKAEIVQALRDRDALLTKYEAVTCNQARTIANLGVEAESWGRALADLEASNARLRAGAASMRERCARWLREDAPQLTTDTALLDLLAERVRGLPLTEEADHVPGV